MNSRKPRPAKHIGINSNLADIPRTVRFIVNDPYATDSSSDENDDATAFRVKKLIVFETNDYRRKTKMQDLRREANCGGRRFRGVRLRPWGRFAEEKRGPDLKVGVWLEEAARKLRGPNAGTTFGGHTAALVDSDGLIRELDLRTSPTSVLSWKSTITSEEGEVTDPERAGSAVELEVRGGDGETATGSLFDFPHEEDRTMLSNNDFMDEREREGSDVTEEMDCFCSKFKFGEDCDLNNNNGYGSSEEIEKLHGIDDFFQAMEVALELAEFTTT